MCFPTHAEKIDAAMYALEENVPRLMQEASQLSGYARYALKANSARYAPGMRQVSLFLSATPSVLKNYTQGYAPKVCAVYIYVKNWFFYVISDGYAPGMRRGKNKENRILSSNKFLTRSFGGAPYIYV